VNLLRSVTRTIGGEAAVFRHFAEKYDLVYFGRFHQDDHEHMVSGVTVSTAHNDQHCCVGTVHGRDMVALRRTDSVSTPLTDKREHYSWDIMQFDLTSGYDFSHVFLDGGHHDELFYQTLFMKFARLMKIDKSFFGDDGHQFAEQFTAYTPPDAVDDLFALLTKDTSQVLATHFAHLDFEWFQDRLLVYTTGRPSSAHGLEHMLRAGLWLTDHLDAYGKAALAPKETATE
jgi:hypothetical protein